MTEAPVCGFCMGPASAEHACAVEGLIPERDADGHAQVWLLYRPEPWQPDAPEEREINLWTRRCDVFTSRDAATAFLSRLLGRSVAFSPYDPLFPELWIYRSREGRRGLMAPAPVDPPGGAQ